MAIIGGIPHFQTYPNKDWWMESSSASVGEVGIQEMVLDHPQSTMVSASDGNHLQIDDKCVLEIGYWTIQSGSRFMCIEFPPKKNDTNINSVQFLWVLHVNLFETTGYARRDPGPGRVSSPHLACSAGSSPSGERPARSCASHDPGNRRCQATKICDRIIW